MRTKLFPAICAVAAALISLDPPAAAQDTREAPLGLIVAASGGSVLRAGNALPLSAKPGDILFANDALRADKGSVTFLSCDKNQQQTLSPDGNVLFEASGPKLRAGKFLDQKPASGCFLPKLPRTIVAAQQDAGAAVAIERTRDMSPPTTFDQRVQALDAGQRTQLTAALAPIEKALQANPADTVKHLERAKVLDQYGLKADAAEEMGKVSAAWPDAAWPKSRAFVLVEDDAKSKVASAAASEPEVEGQTYALLVGISHFQDAGIPALSYAHEDAIELTKLIESPRAGAVPPANVVLLVEKEATRAAIQSAIETHLKGKAGKNDTVLLFIASHGATFKVGTKDRGYIVTYDSNPQELATSGIPMDDIKKLFEEQLPNVKRLLLYVDVCHAGKIGQIDTRSEAVNRATANELRTEEVSMFGLLAAQKGQVAIESINFGGGHGAFTYFLMSALNGKADFNGDNNVTMDELARYVQDRVDEATGGQQIPKQIGDIESNRVMAFVTKPGIELKEFTPMVKIAGRSLTPLPNPNVKPILLPSGLPLTARSLRYQDRGVVAKQFEDAVDQGRILPAEDQGAFFFLGGLRTLLKPNEYALEAERLRVALEDRGQQVLLTYLAGDQTPQRADDFRLGQQYFEAAQTLAPNSLLLQSRAIFCQGRAAIFDKNYQNASTLLERSIGLDPERGYSYNALGISYLERADYDRAILAFKDASARAPYWAYPLHNMALAYVEKGDYDSAIRIYRQAMRLVPGAGYLPYNLGLVYQRMNRPKDAEAMYNAALKISPDNPQTFNALGYLRASEGKRAEAEKYYRQALAKDPELLVARHNLALLLSTTNGRSAEAIALWRENLSKSADYVPSRLSLARYLARSGQDAPAATEYEALVKTKPDYVAARLALADLDARLAKRDEALAQLQEVIKLQPQNADAYERVGDVSKAAGRTAEAAVAYQKAIENSADKAAKKRIQQKARQ